MQLIIFFFLVMDACEAVYWQKLTCPYEVQYQSAQRVWCRQTSTECCTGLTFSPSAHLLDGGKLKVTQDLGSFTVAVMDLSQGEGVYWCGVLSRNNTIIKLAEGYFHRTAVEYIWSYTRWILLLLLPMITTFISIHYRKTPEHISKREGADSQYENVVPLCELE